MAAPRREPLTWAGTRPARLGLGARPRPDVRRPRALPPAAGSVPGRQPPGPAGRCPACGRGTSSSAPRHGRHLSASPRARGPRAPQFVHVRLQAPTDRSAPFWELLGSSCDPASRRAVLLQTPPVPKHLPASPRHLPAPPRSGSAQRGRLLLCHAQAGCCQHTPPCCFPGTGRMAGRWIHKAKRRICHEGRQFQIQSRANKTRQSQITLHAFL